MKTFRMFTAAAAVLFVTATGVRAQDKPFIVEGLAGIAVPTFDITDLADPGPVFGGAFGYMATDKILVMGEFDYGTHSSAVADGPDIDVLHYIGKVGYLVYQSADDKFKLFVNLGAGAVTFSQDADGADSFTYAAINAGAKAYYSVAENVSIVLSPQGDIAFTSEDDGFTGSTGWVWPFTAGVAVNF